MPRGDQIPGETHQVGERVQALVTEVRDTPSAVKIILSRANPELIRRLFEREVPEVGERTIEIKALAREAGHRTKIAVSSIGGAAPRWRRDGRELYFISGSRQLMAAPIDASGMPGTARPLFDVRGWGDFDVARDGRFVAIVAEVLGREQPLSVIVNWKPEGR